MTLKEQLLQEIENTPLSMLGEILNFVQFIKAKQPQEDFMNFAGIAKEIDDTMQEIMEEAENNRQLDLSQEDILSQADTLRQRLKDTYGVFPDSVKLIREDRDR